MNECSLTVGIRPCGEWCIVGLLCSMSEQCNMRVLLLKRSEGSHELKMWFHCGIAESVLYHSELQLLFHIEFIIIWQQSICYTCCAYLHLASKCYIILHKKGPVLQF